MYNSIYYLFLVSMSGLTNQKKNKLLELDGQNMENHIETELTTYSRVNFYIKYSAARFATCSVWKTKTDII